MCGNEFITYPVCKRKYQPTKTEGGVVQLLFACHLHPERGKRIERYGVHPEWQSFDVWHKGAGEETGIQGRKASKRASEQGLGRGGGGAKRAKPSATTKR